VVKDSDIVRHKARAVFIGQPESWANLIKLDRYAETGKVGKQQGPSTVLYVHRRVQHDQARNGSRYYMAER